MTRVVWRIAADTATYAAEDLSDGGAKAKPASLTSIDFGTNWLSGMESALLIVPSAVVPEESAVLINPAHPDSAGITARKLRRWSYDPRLARP